MIEAKFIQIPPTELARNPWNPNQVSPENQEKIKKSLQQLGMFKPVVVRELEDGTLEILAGEHRNDAAIDLGWPTVDAMNLGRIDDETAKKVSLIDNRQFGDDDDASLAEILSELDLDEFADIMRLEDVEIELVTSLKSTGDLDSLDLDLDDDDLDTPDVKVDDKAPTTRTHQILRFKCQIDDGEKIRELISKVKAQQGFTDSDELTNDGDALTYLLNQLADNDEV